ncbi:MAG: deoxyribose-phosphate aldolase [Bdellovibrionaceae bacterium]|nr:deoxyribose-phosphate aldolase [Pseudobdellovibrionaceae bacterium]
MSQSTFASFFDHTILKPDAVATDIHKLCAEALEHKFFSVCVNPTWIPLCVEQLKESSVAVCTVVGFPLGANNQATKVFETEQALKAGATEIDMVINVGALKDKNLALVEQEIRAVVAVCKGKALTKVIVESGLLSATELSWAIECVNASGAEFIKTSTGFANTGATPDAVSQMKREGRSGLKIKARGGIRTAQDFKVYLDLGVDRVGASKSVDIIRDLMEKK